jgi:hypothetical protein
MKNHVRTRDIECAYSVPPRSIHAAHSYALLDLGVYIREAGCGALPGDIRYICMALNIV